MEPDWLDDELAAITHSEQGAMDAAYCEAIARAESARATVDCVIAQLETMRSDSEYWRQHCEDAEMGEYRADLRARRWRMAALTLAPVALAALIALALVVRR